MSNPKPTISAIEELIEEYGAGGFEILPDHSIVIRDRSKEPLEISGEHGPLAQTFPGENDGT